MISLLKKVLPILLILIYSHILPAQTCDSLQTVTIDFQNKPLRQVLHNIARQSNAQFVYNDGLVDSAVITCHYAGQPFDYVLSQVIANADLDFQILPGNIVVLFRANTLNALEQTTSPFKPVRYTLPSPKVAMEPQYPREAMEEGLEGSVEMTLLVGKDGRVKEARIIESSGSGILDNAAAEFASKLTFHPAQKEGKPVDVWVSRTMNYKLIDNRFLPEQYIKRIEQLTEQARHAPHTHISAILHDMLKTHEDLSAYLNANIPLNYNRYIQQIVQTDVYTAWNELWNEWPLHYLVFHDFLTRYPESSWAPKARRLLTQFIEQDLMRVKDSSNAEPYTRLNKDRFVRTLTRFIIEAYPDMLKRNDLHELVFNQEANHSSR